MFDIQDCPADNLHELLLLLPLLVPWRLACAPVGDSNLTLECMGTSEMVSEDIGRPMEEPDVLDVLDVADVADVAERMLGEIEQRGVRRPNPGISAGLIPCSLHRAPTMRQSS